MSWKPWDLSELCCSRSSNILGTNMSSCKRMEKCQLYPLKPLTLVQSSSFVSAQFSNKYTEEMAVDNKPDSNRGHESPGSAGDLGSYSNPCTAGTARSSLTGNHLLLAEEPGCPGVSLPAHETGLTILPWFTGEVHSIPEQTKLCLVSEAIFYVYILSGA